MNISSHLSNFEEISKSLRNEDNEKNPEEINWKLHGLLRTICTYYRYAYCSYEEYQSKCEIYTNNRKEDDKLKIEVALFSIYTNGNICLQTARVLNKCTDLLPNFNEIKSLQDKYRDKAKGFKLFRNNITAHPFNNEDQNGKLMKYILPSLWEKSEIQFSIFYPTKQDDNFEYISAYPVSDIEFLFCYLEELGGAIKDLKSKSKSVM